MCCLVLPVPWLNKPPGVWCPNCDIGVGCKIWDSILITGGLPEECKEFTCVYNQVDCSLDLRPDKCKIIFEKVDDSLFLGTMHPHYNEAYKKRIVQKEIMTLLKRGFSVVVNSFTIEKPIIFAAKGQHASEVWSSLQAQSKERHG
jgi:hypothetical protein